MTAAVSTLMSLLIGTAPTTSAAGRAGLVTSWGGYTLAVRAPASLGVTGATAIAAGDYHGLALIPGGRVVSWGVAGHGETKVPASLTGKTVTAISAGGDHSLALTSDGRVTAWGDDEYGESDVPTSLAGKTVTAIDAGHLHSLALTSDGRVTAWGYDAEGATTVPTSLNGKRVTAISAGAQYNLALTSDGRITAWGWNSYGQTDVPASLAGKRVTAISAGEYYALALTSDGRVTAWGDNEYGEIRVPGSLTGKTVTAIAAGVWHSLALTSDGQVTAWGRNDFGETRIPPALTGKRVTAVASGFSWSMALSQAAAPAVTSSPAPADVQPGAPVSFTAAATGSPTPTVQWQRAARGGTFADVRGATSSTYAFTAARGDDGATFRAVFTNLAGTATTGSAALSVTSPGSCVPAAPKRQFAVDADQRDGDGVIRSPRITTKKSGQLLLAFVSLNRPDRGAQSVARVSGGGLTWTRVQRDDTTTGTSEIWQAYATKKLASTRVAAELTAPGSTVSLTVAGFSRARPTVGASAHRSGTRSAPGVTLTPEASASVVWAVGRAVGSRYDPAPTSGQKIVHEETFKAPEGGVWVQRVTAASTARTAVTVGDKASAEQWGYAAVEIRGTCD